MSPDERYKVRIRRSVRFSLGLDQHQRVPPPRPYASQDQQQDTVSRTTAPIRTCENAQLGTQDEGFEEEVSPCRQREADRGDDSNDSTHRA